MKNFQTQKAENIREVIRYLQKFKNALVVIYLDEKTIESPLFSSHIRDIALLHEAGLKVVIIPGARKRIDQVLKAAGIDWSYENGIRVTTEDAMPLIKMAAFDVSNTVMTSLAANNITAIIGNWVRSRAKGILDGFDFGTAGEIDKLQTDAIREVLNDNFIPIFPCIGWNSVGRPYNISSVLLAQQVATALKADKLFYVMENGCLNASDYIVNESVTLNENNDIAAMNIEEVEEFIKANQGKLKEDNNPKTEKLFSLLKTASDACKLGVTRVHIVDGKIDGVLPAEIFSNLGSGTMIYTSNYGKIRQMLQTDVPAVLSLMRPFIENGKLLPRTEQQLEDQLKDFVVYEIDGAIHGCSALHLYDDTQAEIAAVAVDENFAHMGIGPKMIEHLLEKAKNIGEKSVFILTTQASDWFEKMGFSADAIDTLPEERKKIWSEKRNSKLFRVNF